MNTTTQRVSRPLAVNVALIILLVTFGVSLAPRLARADWSDPLVYLKYGSESTMMLLQLWFIFRGKNWARWFLVALAFAGFCLGLPQLIRQFQEHLVWWVVNYPLLSLASLAQWLALVALFHPSTSEWFLRDRRKRWFGRPRSRHSFETCLKFITYQKEVLGRRRIYDPEGLAESLYHTASQDDEISDWLDEQANAA